jgi:hypothetical protein
VKVESCKSTKVERYELECAIKVKDALKRVQENAEVSVNLKGKVAVRPPRQSYNCLSPVLPIAFKTARTLGPPHTTHHTHSTSTQHTLIHTTPWLPVPPTASRTAHTPGPTRPPAGRTSGRLLPGQSTPVRRVGGERLKSVSG